MKIDRTKLKKCSSEVPPDCKALIDKLKSCSHDELLEELSKVETWNCGKSDLHHWVDVLDIFDHILEISCEKTKENQWCLPCDEPHWANQKKLLLAVLQFTVLLIEHSFSRNCYNSMEHLTTLLSSSDMNVVLAVLNLLYAFSKRLNFIARLNTEKRQSLLLRLLYLAESWGGKLNGFGLAECCEDLDITAYPSSASTLHFEYYAENVDDKSHKKTSNTVIAIHIDNVDKISDKSPSRIMEEIIEKYAVPEDKQMQLFTHIRLAHSFSDYPKRILCVQARLQAISILVYSNGMLDNVSSFLYNGLLEELVDVLELQNDSLIVLKAAALRTLTSIIHLDKNPKISAIIDTTGAEFYHELLPVLVGRCIQSIIDPDSESFPLPFTNILFSFLYYLASYESGRDALVSSGMVGVLVNVINWPTTETEYIRAVRVIDLITNTGMQGFHAHGGFASFIQKLEVYPPFYSPTILQTWAPTTPACFDLETLPENSNGVNNKAVSETDAKPESPKFDLETSSFPPLPGCMEQDNVEIDPYSHNNSRLSDIVKGTVKPTTRDTKTKAESATKDIKEAVPSDGAFTQSVSPDFASRMHKTNRRRQRRKPLMSILSNLLKAKPPISKAQMNEINKKAMKEIKFYKEIVQSVEKFIKQCPPEYKVSGLYIIDSIVKQSRRKLGSDKDVFGPRFVKNITTTFQHLFKCSEKDTAKIIQVLNIWRKKNLFENDVILPLLDMGHPNTSNKFYVPRQKSSDSCKGWPKNTEESVQENTYAEMSTKNLEKFNKVEMSNMVIKEDSHLSTQPKALAPSTCRDEPPPFEYPAEDCNGEFGKDREPFPDDKQPPNRPSGDRFDDGSQQLPPEDFPDQPFDEQYPPEQDQFPPNQRFPPDCIRFPPEQGRFPPGRDRFPPDQERFPPGRERFPPPRHMMEEGGFYRDFEQFPPEDEMYGPPFRDDFPPFDERGGRGRRGRGRFHGEFDRFGPPFPHRMRGEFPPDFPPPPDDCLDSLRQRESAARLQLKKSIQPTLEMPIFKDLIKVEEEDSLSARLKNILGDYKAIGYKNYICLANTIE